MSTLASLLPLLLAGACEQASVLHTELAGNALRGFPHFEHVRSFNESSNVAAAIDPTRFPEIIDRSCDLYVVEARIDEAWAVETTLMDARRSGPRPVIFSGSTVQENTLTIARPGELPSDAGFGLGHGYDIVLDCNRNGVLDAGDVLDGGGSEAGFYVVHDTTRPGPLGVSEVVYSGGEWLTQKAYFPTEIGELGKLPLVVISHGWTHEYTYYDYLGRHLASYGYIVMAHTNDVGRGGRRATQTASTTVLLNTDYIIEQQHSIADGVLEGHIDSNRIAWIGHSTGGEAVVRAYTRLRTGESISESFEAEDIVLVSSIAPVIFWPPGEADPHEVNYHMIVGGADTDASGSPTPRGHPSMAIYERAVGNKQLLYVQGAGHADFHGGEGNPPPSAFQQPPNWASGPELIGRQATHSVVKGYYLPLLELYAKDNAAAKDFFTRMVDSFRPIGIPDAVVIAKEYRDGMSAGSVVIDDFQTNPAVTLSSSGGAVTSDVLHLDEVLMRDQDESFDWTGTEPANGMTRSRFDEESPRCVVFDWTPDTPRYYELEIIPSERDLSDDGFLSFRVAQGTRHPETDALDAPLSFSVTLRDANGQASSIDFGVYGRTTSPYRRTGFGIGAGWGNEFGTVRIRISDFAANGVGIDLKSMVAVRFEFGPEHGSPRGRIGLDDIEITR